MADDLDDATLDDMDGLALNGVGATPEATRDLIAEACRLRARPHMGGADRG